MKAKHVIVLTAFLLASCGGETSQTGPVAEKKQLLSSYKKEMTELRTKIDQLENEIKLAENSDPKSSLRKVETVRLGTSPFEHFVEVQGTVQSDKNVTVNPETSGMILRRLVEEGATVSAGQAIMQIEAENIQRNIEELQTRLELASTVYKRQENLWNQKIGSEIQYLEAKNGKESLERSLATLKTQLDKAFVRSPINGTLDEFFANVGEMANPSMPVARVVNIRQINIEAEVSEAYVRSVKKGDLVTVRFPMLGFEKVAPVTLVGQFIQPQNRTFRIQVKLDNNDGMLKPNALAVLRIRDFAEEAALAVPSQLVQQGTDGKKFVYTAHNEGSKDFARKTTVETGMTYEGKTLIISGLKNNDRLVFKGFNEVTDGEEINVLQEALPALTTAAGSK